MSVMAVTVYLSFQGVDHPSLKEVGEGLLITFRHGFSAQGAAGFWRTSEIASWQLSAGGGVGKEERSPAAALWVEGEGDVVQDGGTPGRANEDGRSGLAFPSFHPFCAWVHARLPCPPSPSSRCRAAHLIRAIWQREVRAVRQQPQSLSKIKEAPGPLC